MIKTAKIHNLQHICVKWLCHDVMTLEIDGGIQDYSFLSRSYYWETLGGKGIGDTIEVDVRSCHIKKVERS